MAATLDGSADNGAVKLQTSTEYIHPSRENILDQTQNQIGGTPPCINHLEMNLPECRIYFKIMTDKIMQFEKITRNYHQWEPL